MNKREVIMSCSEYYQMGIMSLADVARHADTADAYVLRVFRKYGIKKLPIVERLQIYEGYKNNA